MGLLNLGYAAFYAVGAYTYALLHRDFGVGFWVALPAGGLFAALAGTVLGFPVLRLRGDYLAIVTLGFGEIVRLVLENWSALTNGPGGIANVPRPGFFGMDLDLRGVTIYLYFIALVLAAAAALVVAIPTTWWFAARTMAPSEGTRQTGIPDAPAPSFVLILHGRWPDAADTRLDRRASGPAHPCFLHKPPLRADGTQPGIQTALRLHHLWPRLGTGVLRWRPGC